MKKQDLVEGRTYKMTKHYDGNSAGTEVIFKWFTKDGKWAVCNPVGEPSMQDSMCLSPDELEE